MQPNYYGYPYQQPGMSIDKVSNLEEAKKYQVYPGSTMYLLDQDEPYIYVKVCDSSGKSTIRAFSLIEIEVNKITDSKYISRQDFEDFKADMLSVIKEIKGGKSNAKSTNSNDD